MYLTRKELEKRFSKTERRNNIWFEGIWRSYRAAQQWISECYCDHPNQRAKLFDAIEPQSSSSSDYNWLKSPSSSNYNWIFTSEFDDLLIAAYPIQETNLGTFLKSALELIAPAYISMDTPDNWVSTFKKSPIAVENYLNAPIEFQTRRADTFFIKYAIASTLKGAHNRLFLYARLLISIPYIPMMFQLHTYAEERRWDVTYIYFIFGIIVFEFLHWPALAMKVVMDKISTGQGPIRLVRTRFECEEIINDLGSQSYDPETISRRLIQFEKETKTKLPAYVFTLLKRLSSG